MSKENDVEALNAVEDWSGGDVVFNNAVGAATLFIP